LGNRKQTAWEDYARNRKDYSAANLAVLRKITLNLIRLEPTEKYEKQKFSLGRKRIKCYSYYSTATRGKLSDIGEAGQKLTVHRGGGTDTTKSHETRPVFKAGEPGDILQQPCFTLLDTTVILGNLCIVRFPKHVFGK